MKTKTSAAYKRGMKDCYRSISKNNNPFEEGSNEALQWLNGWEDTFKNAHHTRDCRCGYNSYCCSDDRYFLGKPFFE